LHAVSAASPLPGGPSFKAYEIEELIDVYFFRRLGFVVARAAQVLGLSPNAVSVISGVAGMTGGMLLVSDRWVALGVALIVSHGVFDSADGQLARLTGRTSELGRLLDGVSDYVTNVAAYVAIIVRMISSGGSRWGIAVGVLAGVATVVHAQLYDYHRGTYTDIVINGTVRPPAPFVARGASGVNAFMTGYERLLRRLAGAHPAIEAVIADRATGGVPREGDRRRYRARFYRLVRGWNLFGDNVRRYAFCVFAWLHRLEWFFGFILVPLSLAFAAMWIWQWRVDQKFLAELQNPGT